MNYQAYLKSEHWRGFRLRVLDWYDYQCALCNAPDDLQVHHRSYERLGKERLNDCICLCGDCHHKFHKHKKIVNLDEWFEAETVYYIGDTHPGEKWAFMPASDNPEEHPF